MKNFANSAFRLSVIFVCSVWVGIASTSLAYAADVLGTWRGGGYARPKIFDAKEKIHCKIVGKKTGANQISLSGRCAFTRRSGTFKIQLIEIDGGLKTLATANVSGSNDVFKYSGRKYTSGYVMKSVGPISQNGHKFNSQMTISISGGNKLSIRETAVDVDTGKKSMSLVLSLTRQQ